MYTWACHNKGPVYVAMFNPLGMVVALGMGIVFLGDALYLGRLFYVILISHSKLFIKKENSIRLKINICAKLFMNLI